jgi:hypothetical protein
MVQVSPQRLLLSGWLLTNVQVNITIAIYDTGHTLIYITITTIRVLLYTSSILLGWLAVLHSRCPLQIRTSTEICFQESLCKLFTFDLKIFVKRTLSLIIRQLNVHIVYIILCWYSPYIFCDSLNLWTGGRW